MNKIISFILLLRLKNNSKTEALKERRSTWPKHVGIFSFYKATVKSKLSIFFNLHECLGFCELFSDNHAEKHQKHIFSFPHPAALHALVV